MDINYANFRVGQKVEWVSGGRRREGTVIGIVAGDSLKVRTDLKTCPVKTVLRGANPRPVAN